MAGTYPWPRDPSEFITDPIFQDDVDDVIRFRSDDFKMRPFTVEWDEYDTMLYNAWLSVELVGTRFMDPGFLDSLGIRNEVEQLWGAMGMGTLGVTPYPLYPDLVRQFMATLRVRYQDGELYSAGHGELVFKLQGKRFTISLTEFAELYGLDTSSDFTMYSATFRDAPDFFQLIGDTIYDSSENHSNHIRHPVLRYVLKMLASSLFCKTETNKVRTHELLFLYFGISTAAFPGAGREEEGRPHLGAVFAQWLLSLQGRPFGAQAARESVGSLLTPLFLRCGVTGEARDREEITSSLGRQHFVAGHALLRGNRWSYRVDGIQRTIVLPCPDRIGISTSDQLAFRQILAPVPAPVAPRRGLVRHRPSTDASSSAGPSSDIGPPTFGLVDSPSPDYGDPEAVHAWRIRNDDRVTRALNRVRGWLCSGRQRRE